MPYFFSAFVTKKAKTPHIERFNCLKMILIIEFFYSKIICEVIFMSEKQKNMWLSAALSIIEFFILLLVCNMNAHSFSFGYGGEKVAALQKMLKQSGVYEGGINGIFDMETKNALGRLFPESNGEADFEVLEKLGLDCRCCGFSALSELTARYVSGKMKDTPFSAIEKKIKENRISALMRKDPDFFCGITKFDPSSDACDFAYRYEKNKKINNC